MKYLYKQTGVVVESGIKLDSSVFCPLNEEEEKKKQTPEEKKPQRKRTKKTCEE